MLRSRLFWLLFGSYGLLMLAAIGGLGALILNRVEQFAAHETEDSLRAKALLIREAVRQRNARTSPLSQERIRALRREIATRITLLAVDGRVLADSETDPGEMENHADRPEVAEAMRNGIGTATRQSGILGQSMTYLALRTDDPTGEVAVVRVALPLEAARGELAAIRRLVWTAAAVSGLAAMALAFWLVRRIIRPLQELTEGAERIAAGDYGRGVYAAGTDEMGMLARSFNRMSERLATQFAQLEEDRQQLRAILSGMVEGVVALDADQRILFANDRAAQLLEFQAQAAVGRKLWEVFRQRSLQEIVGRALTAAEPCQEELSWNGMAARSLTVHAARLWGSRARGAVLVLHDTSELRRLERLRQDFVANVSHELKTPLSVIKACVETLLDGAMEDAQHRSTFLEQITEQADRLHALILDMLSLARIETGAEAFEFQAVAIEPAVASCLEHHRARAEAQGHTLQQLPPATATPVAAWADEEAVSQILDNLVDNAVKYTPRNGLIQVRWWAEADEVCFEVVDDGIGIAERDLIHIFERFYRVDKARSRELGGTGLGLSIVKHLVQAMHGNVRATSQLGKGCTFSVRLPRAPAS
jgi:two-component system phosphate regulon sensor histidine kinase PhoR